MGILLHKPLRRPRNSILCGVEVKRKSEFLKRRQLGCSPPLRRIAGGYACQTVESPIKYDHLNNSDHEPNPTINVKCSL
jgi:hypothetical protein